MVGKLGFFLFLFLYPLDGVDKLGENRIFKFACT